MGCGDEKLSKYLTQTFTAHCNAMICQQVTLSGDAEWPKVADAVIEAGIPVSNGRRAGMCPAILLCASALTGPPVASAPPVRCAPRRKTPPRQLTVRPQAHHEAIQAARQRQKTPEFKAQYALRSGVESSLSQGIRRFHLRQSRYIGLARTHLQHLLTAVAMNVVRVIAWLRDEPLGERRRKPGHFARLAPHPLSRQTVLC